MTEAPDRGSAAPWLLAVIAVGGALWYGFAASWVPLSIVLGTGAALFSLRISQEGVARYGRRIPVTEMLALGRQGDRAMLLGGLAGYVMLACFVVAGWLAS